MVEREDKTGGGCRMPEVWRRGGNAGAYRVPVWKYQEGEGRKGKEGVGERGRDEVGTAGMHMH